MGLTGFDSRYLTIERNGVWVRLATKDSQNPNGDNSLVGLVIDWHLAEYDVPADVSTASVLDTDLAYQPTYAYA